MGKDFNGVYTYPIAYGRSQTFLHVDPNTGTVMETNGKDTTAMYFMAYNRGSEYVDAVMKKVHEDGDRPSVYWIDLNHPPPAMGVH